MLFKDLKKYTCCCILYAYTVLPKMCPRPECDFSPLSNPEPRFIYSFSVQTALAIIIIIIIIIIVIVVVYVFLSVGGGFPCT